PACAGSPGSLPAPTFVVVTVPLPPLSASGEAKRSLLLLVAVKVAVAFLAASMVSWQVVAVPVQSPLQPAKVEPVAGAAVSVTVAPSAKSCVQVAPQSMPA